MQAERARIIRDALWTSSTQRQSQWTRGNPSTKEGAAEPVAYPIRSPRRYQSSSQDWQHYGDAWDRVQARVPTGETLSGPERLPPIFTSRGSIRTGANTRRCFSPDGREEYDAMAVPSSYRPYTPGYQGFVPAAAANAHHSLYPRGTAPTETFTASTHRNMEPISPRQVEHVRTAPLSNMVTIYTPYNPFNLIGAPQPPPKPTRLETLRRQSF